MKLPTPKMIPGMTWGTHRWIFISWIGSALGFSFAYYKKKEQKDEAYQAFVDFYRYSGEYKHPWEDTPVHPKALEAFKSVDYPKMVVMPK